MRLLPVRVNREAQAWIQICCIARCIDKKARLRILKLERFKPGSFMAQGIAKLKVILAVLAPFICTAGIVFDETQETIKPWNVQLGFGQITLGYSTYHRYDTLYYDTFPEYYPSFGIQGFPEAWLRTGITERLELCAAYDLDYNYIGAGFKYGLIKDYLAAGADAEMGFGTSWGDWSLQGTLIGGYPGKVIVPYAILRVRNFYSKFLEPGSARLLCSTNLALGARLKLLRILSLYGELGVSLGKFSRGTLTSPGIAAPFLDVGASFDINLKEMFYPLLK